jgi:hypothetical protein
MLQLCCGAVRVRGLWAPALALLLACCAVVSWYVACDPTDHRDPRFVGALRLPLPQAERAAALGRLLAAAKRMFDDAGIAYWLDAGTLLGAWRAGAVIPWDLDADVGVDHAGYERLRQGRGVVVAPGFRLEVWRSAAFPDEGRRDAGIVAKLFELRSGCWVDVEHYLEYELPRGQGGGQGGGHGRRALTRVWMNNGACEHCAARAKDTRRRPLLPREWVLPLVPCLLGGLNHTCPRQPRRYLAHFFGDRLGVPSWWRRNGGAWLAALGVWAAAAAVFAIARRFTGSELGVRVHWESCFGRKAGLPGPRRPLPWA